jgi:hypothetical protein
MKFSAARERDLVPLAQPIEALDYRRVALAAFSWIMVSAEGK